MKKPWLELWLELWLERFLFASRWLLAPFYVGLVLALAVVMAVFGVELWSEVQHLLHVAPAKAAEAAIVMSLSLIDLSLAANLLLIVIFSGYENFISRIDTAEHEDRPDWMGTVDFSGLKMKLIASIVAISAIALLRNFLEIGDSPMNEPVLMWQVLFHLTFVVSGVLLALMDFIASKTDKHGGHDA
jgi:uncharacterized protein (TIGR00645 family)